MTKMRFFTVIGAATLLLGFGLNLQYALDDYGFTTNSLSGFMLVQAEGGSSSSGYWPQASVGKQLSSYENCTIVGTGSSSNSNNSTGTNGATGATNDTIPVSVTQAIVYYCSLPTDTAMCYNYNTCGVTVPK